MLQSKPLSDITYADVVQFCEQGKQEGKTLDYKQDFAESVPKTITAFANTFGGDIIVGVADKDDKPMPPYTGIEYKDGYVGKIENMVYEHIKPALLIDTHVCTDDTGKHAFVVIRVPQSINTPHLFDGMAVIRTGQSSRREEIASPDQLAWLFERRQHSLELKHNLYQRSGNRFNNWVSGLGFVSPDQIEGVGNAVLNLSVCPVFPNGSLFSHRDAATLLEKLAHDHQMRFNKDATRVVAGGALNLYGQIDPKSTTRYGTPAEGEFDYLELDEHGLFIQRSPASHAFIREIPYLELAHHVIYFLAAARSLYQRVAYPGYVDFSCSITNAAGRWVDVKDCRAARELVPSQIVDGAAEVHDKFGVIELEEQFKMIACRVLDRVAYACGLNGTDDTFHSDVIDKSDWLRNILALGR